MYILIEAYVVIQKINLARYSGELSLHKIPNLKNLRSIQKSVMNGERVLPLLDMTRLKKTGIEKKEGP